MKLFNKLPGFVRSAPVNCIGFGGSCRPSRLWGTRRRLALAGVNCALAPTAPAPSGTDAALLLWDHKMFGFVLLQWMLILTVTSGCFIGKVMKGPAYMADAYPLSEQKDGATDVHPVKD